MEPTISRFILLLFAYVLFTVASYKAVVLVNKSISQSNSIKNKHAISIAFMTTLLSAVFMFIFLRILTGNNYFLLFMFIFVISISITFISEIFWIIFGSKNIQWFGVTVWMDFEFKVLHPKLNMFLQLLQTLILIVYPVYIGIGYFGDAFESPEWDEYVMHSTIVILIGMSWLSMIPSTLNIFLSKHPSNVIRAKLILNHITAVFSIFVYIPLFISPSNPSWKNPFMVGGYFIFSPTVFMTITAYIIAIVIIPSAVGRIKHLRLVGFLNSQLDAILESAISELSINKDSSPLSNTQNLIERFHDQLYLDESLDLVEDYQHLGDDADKVMLLGLDEFKKSDPRLIILENIALFKEKVFECISALESEQSDDKKRDISTECISMLKLQMCNLRNRIHS